MINLSYQGKEFNQRESDNYVNLGELCATHKKKLNDWSRLKSSKAYLEAVSGATGIPVADLISVQNGNATWGHPLVAIEVARWINPAFGVWCNQNIKTLIEAGQTQIAPPLPQLANRDIVEYIEASKTLESLQDGVLKALLKDGLVDEIELSRNTRALPGSTQKYTIVKVRAKFLGYTEAEIGRGTELGKFVRSRIEPAFQEIVGRYPVYHYLISDRLDTAIHTFFGAIDLAG